MFCPAIENELRIDDENPLKLNVAIIQCGKRNVTNKSIYFSSSLFKRILWILSVVETILYIFLHTIAIYCIFKV